MIPEKFRILMNNEIDGANTPAERDELDLYLVRHPEARRYFEELRHSLEVLEEIGNVEPPADLHGRIMAAVDRLTPVRRKAATHRLSWREIVFGRLRMGYAFSVAIGVMLGFLMHTLVPVDGMGRDLTALELFRGTATSELMEGWVAAGPLDLAQGSAKGQVHAFRQNGKVLVRLRLTTDDESRVGFRFPETAQLQGIHFSDNQGFRMAAAGRDLEFRGAGVCRCEFLVEGASGPDISLEVQFESDAGSPISRYFSWP